MQLDPQIMQQLLQVFTGELDVQIQAITDGLLKLEKGVDGNERRTVFEDIFRSAHNIKGAARGVEVLDVSNIAHHLESLFSQLKRANIIPPAELIDLSLECMDHMHEALNAYKDKTPLGFDMDALLQRIESYLDTEEEGATTQQPSAPAALAAGTSTEAPASLSKPDAESVIEPPALKQPPSTLENEAKTETEAEPESESQPKPSMPRTASSDIIRISVDKLEPVSAAGEELQVYKIEMDEQLESVHELQIQLEEFSNIWKHTLPILQHGSHGLPVEVMQLLERSTGGLNALNTTSRQVLKAIRSSTNRLGILTNSLQHDIRMLRLVPVASLLRPLSRTVRDISRELGKEVDYQIQGDDIEMDRAVLDGVRDPLIHLLRNAIDHGLENPEQRTAAGKPATGKLNVQVQAVGSQIRMIIHDDGAGIDVKKIAETARKRKVATDTELAAMSDEDILDMIFRPGFSSKEIVTNVSGRGVGLDVVRANLRKLKGSVQLDTKLGEGTTFTLNLPLTLATDHGMMVRANNNIYAIPTTSVHRVMELEAKDIIEVEASQAIIVEGRTIPLRSLSSLLEMPSEEPAAGQNIPVILVSKGWNIVGLVVNEILGEREIVIKSLQPPLMSVRNVTGGTLTGSGDIIMVLNPSDLVDSALKPGISSHVMSVSTGEEEAIKLPRILVVDDSITTRTLEKNILEAAGYEVVALVDGKQAWEFLQEESVDLVVTDIEMPNMNGFELTEKIKQADATADLPVIIVTSLAKDEDQQRGIDVGANAYIVKGEFETRMLLDVVRQMV